MALIQYLAGEDYVINDLNGSGLGFYGATFGQSVRVGYYQDTTFITNAAGNVQGPQVDNVKYLNAASGILGGGASGIGLKLIPNYQSTLNIRFTHGSTVQVTNAELRIFDRYSYDNNPSGVTCKVAEIIHPDTVQNNNGSGDASWITAYGSGSVVSLCPSPGISGLYAGNGSNSTRSDTQHDWFVAISASPDSIGSKTQFGLRFSLEYL